MAVTFWPHPMSVIRPDQAPPCSARWSAAIELLTEAGVDEVVVLEFTPEVASWSPEEFVDRVLRPLDPARIVVGENFRFGFRAAGDPRPAGEAGRRGLRGRCGPLFSDGTQPSSRP